jgi:hypothetical protein
VYDGGLSRNGTFLNGKRVQGHRVLYDSDRLIIGATDLCFRDTTPQQPSIVMAGETLAGPHISRHRRRYCSLSAPRIGTTPCSQVERDVGCAVHHPHPAAADELVDPVAGDYRTALNPTPSSFHLRRLPCCPKPLGPAEDARVRLLAVTARYQRKRPAHRRL